MVKTNTFKIFYFLEVLLNGFFVIIFSWKKIPNFPPFLNFIPQDILSFWFAYLAIIPIFLTLYAHVKNSHNLEDFLRKYVFSLIVLFPLFLTWGDSEFTFWLVMVHAFSTLISLVEPKAKEFEEEKSLGSEINLNPFNFSPTQLVVISFVLIILGGALLLALPISAAPGKSISLVDALFMSTSATCVTGLATKSLADDFSLFGQIVLLSLIQIGGLGIMTLSSSVALFMGKSMGVRQQVLMQGVLDANSSEELLKLIIDIVKFTLLIEFIGAIILAIGFHQAEVEIGQAIYWGFFHSISAFCNAGLGLLNDSMVQFQFKPLIHFTISTLVILGGLGFSVIQELLAIAKKEQKISQLTLHSKIVLSTSLALIAFGTFYLFFAEYLNSFTEFTLWQKIQVSYFHSVITRTAGFNSVDITTLHPHTVYMMILLMFIGGSPGSTAGGVKTTTFAILMQSVKSTLFNRPRVVMFERTLSNLVVVRSIALFMMSLVLVSTTALVLMKIEADKSFLALLFEIVSAFGTVGLSMGITPALTAMGKIVICLVMYIGRVGPLTLILAVADRSESNQSLKFPESKVLIG